MKWISVKERLPKEKQWVLVTNEHGEMFTGWYEHKYKNWHLEVMGYYPTHWMLLPEKPE